VSSTNIILITGSKSQTATKAKWKNWKLCLNRTSEQYFWRNREGWRGCVTKSNRTLMTNRLSIDVISPNRTTMPSSKCRRTENSSKRNSGRSKSRCKSRRSNSDFPWAAWKIR
jgi:hypothetical protein